MKSSSSAPRDGDGDPHAGHSIHLTLAARSAVRQRQEHRRERGSGKRRGQGGTEGEVEEAASARRDQDEHVEPEHREAEPKHEMRLVRRPRASSTKIR